MQWAERCLKSIANSKHSCDAFIVDNGSTDGTQDFILKNFPEFKFVQSEVNLGFGAANNIGLKYAVDHNYDFVYLLNQDAWIFPDTVERLIALHTEHPEFGILSPMQFAADTKHLDTGFKRIYDGATDTDTPELRTVTSVMAAHWFLPIEIVKKVGGFSPTFFHYGEDFNYTDRIHYHDYLIGVAKNARAVHDRFDRPTSREKDLYLKDTSNLIRLSNPEHSFCLNLVMTAFYAVAFAAKSTSFSPLKGFFKQLRCLKSIRNNRTISQQPKAFL